MIYIVYCGWAQRDGLIGRIGSSSSAPGKDRSRKTGGGGVLNVGIRKFPADLTCPSYVDIQIFKNLHVDTFLIFQKTC